MKASLAVAGRSNAIELRRSYGTVVHFDRGSQFRSKKFVRLLRNNALVGSMGRTGACADNAAMESFFALLQNNVLDRQRWQTREELRLAIVTWIERTYYRRRRNEGSASSPRSSSKQCTRLLMPHDDLQPCESTEVGAVPMGDSRAEQGRRDQREAGLGSDHPTKRLLSEVPEPTPRLRVTRSRCRVGSAKTEEGGTSWPSRPARHRSSTSSRA